MNLFMHYAFDLWMKRYYPQCPFARYADDAVVHCRNQAQAEDVMQSIASRLAECGLTMHPEKSKIVYCKHSKRTKAYQLVQFTFLGFTFRPRGARKTLRRHPRFSADWLGKMKMDFPALFVHWRGMAGKVGYPSAGGPRALKSFWEVPVHVTEEPDNLREWAQRAYRAALKAGNR